MVNKEIYQNAEYNVVTDCWLLKQKHGDQPLKYKLKDYAKNLFGNDFLGNYPDAWDFNKSPAVVSFLARMSAYGKSFFDNSDTIVYGKIFTLHAGFSVGELMLLRELDLSLSIKEVQELINSNKIKI